MKRRRLGILATHPIQYYASWYRALAQQALLTVFFAHEQSASEQADAGFGVAFDWDVPLLDGFEARFLRNRSPRPNVSTFLGCDTPDIESEIRNGGFDAFIVHGWYTKSFLQALRACRRHRVPVLVRGDSQLVTHRSFLWKLTKRPLYQWLLSRFDGYLCVGQRNREYYLHYGADADRIFFAPHAVDNEFFATKARALQRERPMLRRALGIPPDAIVYLFAGKLIGKKRPADYLRALQQASREQPTIHGLLVGDGPLRAELQELAQQERIAVSFAGFMNQSRIPEAYAASDLIVLPSDGRETWGLVVNEAMACGLPALVSDAVGCGPDLVHRGITGDIFPVGDVHDLAQLMSDWGKDRSRLLDAGVRARELSSRYSVAVSVAGTMAAIESICSSQDADRVINPPRSVARLRSGLS